MNTEANLRMILFAYSLLVCDWERSWAVNVLHKANADLQLRQLRIFNQLTRTDPSWARECLHGSTRLFWGHIGNRWDRCAQMYIVRSVLNLGACCSFWAAFVATFPRGTDKELRWKKRMWFMQAAEPGCTEPVDHLKAFDQYHWGRSVEHTSVPVLFGISTPTVDWIVWNPECLAFVIFLWMWSSKISTEFKWTGSKEPNLALTGSRTEPHQCSQLRV